MKRSASETIRELEGRIARLEGKTANKNANLMISTSWYTGGPRSDERDLTLSDIVDEAIYQFEAQQERLMEDIEEGDTERGTNFDVLIDIGYGQLRINSGVDDGTDHYQAGCVCCLWCAFVAAGLHQEDYETASKKLASMLKSKLSRFSPMIEISKP